MYAIRSDFILSSYLKLQAPASSDAWSTVPVFASHFGLNFNQTWHDAVLHKGWLKSLDKESHILKKNLNNCHERSIIFNNLSHKIICISTPLSLFVQILKSWNLDHWTKRSRWGRWGIQNSTHTVDFELKKPWPYDQQ